VDRALGLERRRRVALALKVVDDKIVRLLGRHEESSLPVLLEIAQLARPAALQRLGRDGRLLEQVARLGGGGGGARGGADAALIRRHLLQASQRRNRVARRQQRAKGVHGGHDLGRRARRGEDGR
jgi:hypothetical protein